jgi:RNA polymerase sigma factor (sigma-70 family)
LLLWVGNSSPARPDAVSPALAPAAIAARLKTVSTSSHANTSGTTPHGSPSPRHPAFVTTQWTVVLSAASSDTPRARAALENLCQTYWHPLYAYVRRRGYSPEDAQDLTQEFFARLLERNAVATVAREKGRFRSFLLASMNNFLSDEWDRARAQKRGGGKVFSMDMRTAETWLGEAVAGNLTPEKAYEHRWAITLLEQVYERLGEEYRQQGKSAVFEALRTTLAGKSDAAPYVELARQLGMTEGAVKVAVHRLRRRYRALLRDTIADTVAGPDEVEDELKYLFRTLAGE